MRPIFTILLILWCFTISAQKYSSVIRDTAITNFMNWLFKSDTAFKAVRHVDNDILKSVKDDFIYPDSLQLTGYQFAQNIFSKQNKLGRYFNEKDAEFFVQQTEHQYRDKWQLKIKGIELFDTITLVNNRVDKMLFSYSLPLFSADRKYVIIIAGYYCGLVCGGGDYNLYERQADNCWKLVKQFNHWDE